MYLLYYSKIAVYYYLKNGVIDNHLFISVTLRGMRNETFRGFLVQLRSSNQDIVANQLTATGADIKQHACTPPTGGFTHTSRSDKDYITFTWTPTAGSRDLVFRLIGA